MRENRKVGKEKYSRSKAQGQRMIMQSLGIWRRGQRIKKQKIIEVTQKD